MSAFKKDQRSGCDHTHLFDRLAQHEEKDRRFTEGIERLLESHQPVLLGFGKDSLRPGNSHDNVAMTCDECRTQWPCRIFNDLRRLYGEVNDWEPATRPYEPVLICLTPKES